ncbi:MAG: phosphoglucosamine mutase, partial [Gammaproteobacteria bacterium]|nr:phosphoglucosamine mutase [Gammaproteobacteria bacterium]
TVESAVRLANAIGRALVPPNGRVIVGKDPRVSSYMFEAALEAGFVAAGVNVELARVMPTPSVAYLTKAMGADLGVMISASHNRFEDNGIKFFNRHGHKLRSEQETAVLDALDQPIATGSATELGRATTPWDVIEIYREFCLSTVSPGLKMPGKRIVIDCANGASYKVGPRVFSELGDDLVSIGCSPNGTNINQGFGSTEPELLQKTVTALGAEVGIAFDGDGDRVIMVDHNGDIVDGDVITLIIALDRHQNGQLTGPVVGTLMSNLGLEHALRDRGIEFMRTQVGDRHILAALQEHNGIIGGEDSGHIVCLDKTTTGDGIIAALQVIDVMARTGKRLADLAGQMIHYPQTLINCPLDGQEIEPEQDELISQAMLSAKQQLGDDGRILVRRSGTEPVMRVMVEGVDSGAVEQCAEQLADVIRQRVKS